MFYCERCGDADCCERLDLPTEPVLCDACYEKETREKLIDVFMHIGDHITNRDEYGICFDTPLVKAIEDVLAMLKSQDANGVLLAKDESKLASKWISVKDRLPEDESNVLAYLRIGEEGRIYPAHYAKGVWWDCIFSTPTTRTTTHWMPLPEPPKE